MSLEGSWGQKHKLTGQQIQEQNRQNDNTLRAYKSTKWADDSKLEADITRSTLDEYTAKRNAIRQGVGMASTDDSIRAMTLFKAANYHR